MINFLKEQWKNIALFTLITIIITNIVKHVGKYLNDILFPTDYTTFDFLAIQYGTPPWVSTISNIVLAITSVILVIYLLRKKVDYKNVFKVAIISTLIFLAVSIIQLADTIIQFFYPAGNLALESSDDFISSLELIAAFIFNRIVYIPLFFIILPSAIVLTIYRYKFVSKLNVKN